MSLDSRFSEQEQLLLTSTPSLIGSAMAFTEGSGLGTIKELYVNAKTFIGGAKAFPDNEIVVGVLPNLEDRKEAMAKAKEGGFLGFGGERVSAGEKGIFAEIAQALGASSQLI